MRSSKWLCMPGYYTREGLNQMSWYVNGLASVVRMIGEHAYWPRVYISHEK
jgi:hypothetical protein